MSDRLFDLLGILGIYLDDTQKECKKKTETVMKPPLFYLC